MSEYVRGVLETQNELLREMEARGQMDQQEEPTR